MTRLLILLLIALPIFAETDVRKELDEVARVASVMLDGDICQRILTPRSAEYLTKEDPRDRWAGSDNYDVDHEAFISTKKTLIRLSRLTAVRNDVNLWMPVPGAPDKVHIVIRNANEMSQFWPWGKLSQEMIPEMREVLTSGKRMTVTKKPGWISVLAPVSNSLGDIVGLVEVVSQNNPDSHENVK